MLTFTQRYGVRQKGKPNSSISIYNPFLESGSSLDRRVAHAVYPMKVINTTPKMLSFTARNSSNPIQLHSDN